MQGAGTGPGESAIQVQVTVNFTEDPAAASAEDFFVCVADLAEHLCHALGRAGGAGAAGFLLASAR